MQSVIDRTLAEARETERAWRWQKASSNLATVKREIANDETKLAALQPQLDALDVVLTASKDLARNIEGVGGANARDIIRLHAREAKKYVAVRIERLERNIKAMQRELPRMENDVAELAK